jgi:CRISPR-associated RAMP protein (TIGR02581 family)
MINPRGFTRRYLFTGTLALRTGLHIGSGWTVGSPSDNPVIRTPDGKPFIPGSSFKGAFRSMVEKLAQTIGLATELKSCGLMEGQGCIGAQGKEQDAFNKRSRDWKDDRLLAELDDHLCDTCKLFGSPYAASRITFADLLPTDESEAYAETMIQIRDGVAIDRDSEKAVDKLKYDYEVVAPAQTFKLEILLEDPTNTDLGLTCVGLSEFVSGLGYVGGKRSRGLGNCRLDDLYIYGLDLSVDVPERAERLKNYLLGSTLEEKMTRVEAPEAFMDHHITALLNGKGA